MGNDSFNPADQVLYSVTGRTWCNLTAGVPLMTVSNPDCTAPCTLLHESTHVADIASCCVRAGIAYRNAPAAAKAGIRASWGAWLVGNRSWFECRAYSVSETCATAMNLFLLCWAPQSVVGSVLVGATSLAGGLIGAQLLGAGGATAGAGAGLSGGPAAPVTVPAGATAGFISGELLGFLGGSAVGALVGAGAEDLRRECCRKLAVYRRNATSRKSTNCGAAGGAPVCPF